MESVKYKLSIAAYLVVSVMLTATGCNENTEQLFCTGKGRFLSPDKPILSPDSPKTNWIVEGVGDLDKPTSPYANAERPGPDDWTYSEADYVEMVQYIGSFGQ